MTGGTFFGTGSLSMGNNAAPSVPNTTALTTVNSYTGSFMVTGGSVSMVSSVTTVSVGTSAIAISAGKFVPAQTAPSAAGTVGLVSAGRPVPSPQEQQAELATLKRTDNLNSSAMPATKLASLNRGWARGGAGKALSTLGVSGDNYSDETETSGGMNTTAFDGITENDFLAVRDNPLSTFSVDVDTASYAIVRRFLNSNQLPPKGAVRTEELLNYFSYDYPQPQGDVPFSATMEVGACPWEPEHRLVRVGLKGRDVPRDQRPPSNLVFLVDVSGSMNMPNKLPLLQESFRLLIDQLGPKDRVAIVTYAGSTGILLNSTQDKEAMQAAVNGLRAHGSTNGASGVKLAYQVAEQNFIKGGTNRVILATDGDWNVGITNQSDLLEMIAQKSKSGVFLTVLGFGMDNLKDSMLVKLADRGNGHYAYIDTPLEAKKVFVEQLSGTLVTIAKDVKVQVEFNPAHVGAYRLIGYEKRLLAKEDFNNDKKDAGEIGAGHTVTALYEVVPAGKEMPPIARVDKLKYAALAAQPIPGAAPVEQPVAAAAQAQSPTPTTETASRSVPTQPAPQNPHSAEGTVAELHPNAPSPKSAPQEKKSSLNKITTQTTSDGRVTVTLDKVEADGSITHTIALADRAEPNADTGEVFLYGMPDVTQGMNRCIATSPQTWMKLARDGYLEAHGPHRTFVVDNDRDGSKAAPEHGNPGVLPASVRNEMLTLKLRYKAPDGDTSKLLEFPLTDGGATWEKSSPDFRFAAAVAGYGMLLHDSTHRGQTTWDSVAQWAREGLGADKSGYREEFLDLVKKAKVMAR